MAESVPIAVEWAKSIAPSVAKVASDDMAVLNALKASQNRKHKASIKKAGAKSSPARHGKPAGGGGGGSGGPKPPRPVGTTKQAHARAGPGAIQRQQQQDTTARPTPTPPVRGQPAQSQPANVGFFGSAMSSPAASQAARNAAAAQDAARFSRPSGQRVHPWTASVQQKGYTSGATVSPAPTLQYQAPAPPQAVERNPFIVATDAPISPTTAAANPFLNGVSELVEAAARAEVMSEQKLTALLPKAVGLMNRESVIHDPEHPEAMAAAALMVEAANRQISASAAGKKGEGGTHGDPGVDSDSDSAGSKSPVVTENLLEKSDGVLRPAPEVGAAHQCSLGAAPYYLLFMLTRAILMPALFHRHLTRV